MYSQFTSFQIKSIVSCLPSDKQLNSNLPFDKNAIEKVSKSSGIFARRIADESTTASDLCVGAATHILNNIEIDKTKIGVLVFVTQYPDYILPSTAHIIKDRLRLDNRCIAIQINEGCSGYIYGLQLCLSLMNSGSCEYGLLLAGDTTSKVLAKDDTGTRPIFGDAGSATLLKREPGNIKIEVGSDGSGYQDIVVERGGYRFSSNEDQRPTLDMNGMNVFMFGISKVPKYIKKFCNVSNTNLSSMDYIVLHQANKMMNERIIRKLEVEQERALYSLEEFGNTSSASIPLTITYNLKSIESHKKILACGFGVGLSWGTATFELSPQCFLDTVEHNP